MKLFIAERFRIFSFLKQAQILCLYDQKFREDYEDHSNPFIQHVYGLNLKPEHPYSGKGEVRKLPSWQNKLTLIVSDMARFYTKLFIAERFRILTILNMSQFSHLEMGQRRRVSRKKKRKKGAPSEALQSNHGWESELFLDLSNNCNMLDPENASCFEMSCFI